MISLMDSFLLLKATFYSSSSPILAVSLILKLAQLELGELIPGVVKSSWRFLCTIILQRIPHLLDFLLIHQVS